MTPGLTVLLFAQMTTAPNPADSEEVVVRAMRLEREVSAVPAPVSVQTADDLRGLQGLSLAEGLATIPGVYAQNRTNFAQDLRLAVRGFGARGNFGVRGVKILIDGIPATLPDGQSQVDNLILSDLERIEVLRGGASALYGNGSGGVVSMETAGLSDQTYIEAGVDIASEGYHRSRAQFAGGNSKVALRLGLWEMNIDGYRDHAASEAAGGNLRAEWKMDAVTRAGLLVSYFDAPLEQDPGGINAAQAEAEPTSARDRNVLFGAGEEVEQWQMGATLSRELGQTSQFDARAYFVDRSFENRLPFTGGGAVDLQRELWGAGFAWEATPQWGDQPLTLQVGLDFDEQDDRRRRFDNLEGVRGNRVLDQSESVTSLGVFAQVVLDAGPGQLTGGLRYDRIRFDVTDRYLNDGDDAGETTVEEVSPSLAYSLPLGAQWTAYAAFGTSFESPTTTELANPTGGGFNTNLDAQQAKHYDLGLRGSAGALSVDLALFAIDLEDELTPFELPEFPGRSFFRNAGESERRGVEAALGWAFTDQLSLNLTYTHSDFEFEQFVTPGNDFSGRRLPGVPRHQGTAGLAFRGEHGRFANLTVRHSGALYADNRNANRVPSYTVTDLRFGQTWDWSDYALTAHLGINNLTDERYFDNIRINAFGGRFFEPAPDRQVFGGITVRWQR